MPARNRVKTFAVVVAGGSGQRAGGSLPKQFQAVQGRLLIEYSLEALFSWPRISGLVLVGHPDFADLSRQLLTSAPAHIQTRIAVGGATRHGSTLSGLHCIQADFQPAPEDLILIHDAARPLITALELDRLYALFENPMVHVASLASAVVDTLVQARVLPGPIAAPLDRSQVFAVKTPQALRQSAWPELQAAPVADYTDLLTWAHAAGLAAHLAEAGPDNRKITEPADFDWLRLRLSKNSEGN